MKKIREEWAEIVRHRPPQRESAGFGIAVIALCAGLAAAVVIALWVAL